jgi:hypothetical protein
MNIGGYAQLMAGRNNLAHGLAHTITALRHSLDRIHSTPSGTVDATVTLPSPTEPSEYPLPFPSPLLSPYCTHHLSLSL